ncbi:MAG: hypothetical protein AVDCRST_MAG18-872 [uncultured Thermomicrobiales bacterium]|uniref:Uncharacterized protein n=1 Tax=uncultured Thermomicrobiales bacterium TaxID=1645740 RepID=A0A6J4USC7_9BACT|nr:MAG: hypothetical protein AVDCRST_MAG18-872 [uncultured Thermomicrobiales bacterium]
MSPRSRILLLGVALLLALPLALGACGGASERSITGQVVAVDATAKTFSVQATDGKRYDFKAGGGVDIVHVKEHMDGKKQIEVKYSGTTSPYEASHAH